MAEKDKFDQETIPEEEASKISKPSPPAQKVLVLRDYCTHAKGSDCKRCLHACPHEALSFSEEGVPVIDSELCTNCGICFGICDTFSSNRVTLTDLHSRVERIALTGDPVYFTCRENVFPGFEPASNVIVLPCLACLPPELWTLILTENISVVVACDLSYCADCERAGELAEMLYSRAIEIGEEWSGRKVRFSEEIPEKEKLLEGLTKQEGIERRGVFTNLMGDVGDIASGKRRLRNSEVLQQFVERRERSHAIAQLNLTEVEEINSFAPLGRTKKLMPPKRRMLLEALNRDPAIASRIPLEMVSIDREKCSEEYCCTKACPTGALSPDPDTGALVLDERYCIGCGICLGACPHVALSLNETTAEIFVPKETEETLEESNDD